MGAFGAVWGLAGLIALLVYAVARLGVFALELTEAELGWHHWLALAASVAFMAYSEGYRGFQRAFSPRTAARARHLSRHPRLLHVVLAPLFCMGYFHTTRRRMIVSYSLTVMIIGFIIVARMLEQPWRGILDAGVVVGLAWGILSLLASTHAAFTDPDFAASPELPG